jgi:hypothetical protein
MVSQHPDTEGAEHHPQRKEKEQNLSPHEGAPGQQRFMATLKARRRSPVGRGRLHFRRRLCDFRIAILFCRGSEAKAALGRRFRALLFAFGLLLAAHHEEHHQHDDEDDNKDPFHETTPRVEG